MSTRTMLRASRNNANQGRGGRGFGRNGRTNGHRNGSNNAANSSKKKDDNNKKYKKFHPLTKGKSPEHSFDDVKKELVKTLELSDMDKADDIIDSVRNMTLLDLDALRPNLVPSVAATRAEREREDVILTEAHRYDMKKWDSRVDHFANNKRKVHAKVLKFCTETMEEKLEREPDFDTTLYRDPIALLEQIKRFMTTSEDTDWEFFGLWEALKKMVNCNMNATDSPSAFRKQFDRIISGTGFVTRT